MKDEYLAMQVAACKVLNTKGLVEKLVEASVKTLRLPDDEESRSTLRAAINKTLADIVAGREP